MEIEKIKNLVTEILQKMTVEFSKITVEEKESFLYVNVESSEAPLLIGREGKNLDALQNILKLMLFKNFPEKKFFLILDVENFRKRKQEQILEIARERAEAVRATRATQVLPPMNPFLRRLVHLELTKKEFADLATDSFGEGDSRRIRIVWKGESGSDF